MCLANLTPHLESPKFSHTNRNTPEANTSSVASNLVFPKSNLEVLKMDSEDVSWVVDEFGFASLGDERRTNRLVKLASSLAESPTASFPEALKSQAELTATYRFFDNDQIDAEDILASHTGASLDRLRSVPVVLSVQDTTEFNFTSHKALEDAGPLTHANCQGFFAHTTLAITPERVPLGVLSQLVWAREKDHPNKRATRKNRPIEEKESNKCS
jgi:hypothetical protein